MTALQEHRGLMIFCIIAVILFIIAFAAYQATGPMGIEERFNAAAGISPEEDGEGEGGIAGFSIEGNTLLYLLILLVLVMTCVVIYRRFHE